MIKMKSPVISRVKIHIQNGLIHFLYRVKYFVAFKAREAWLDKNKIVEIKKL